MAPRGRVRMLIADFSAPHGSKRRGSARPVLARGVQKGTLVSVRRLVNPRPTFGIAAPLAGRASLDSQIATFGEYYLSLNRSSKPIAFARCRSRRIRCATHL